MRHLKKGLITFAILCAVLMLLTTTVRPVTATESSIIIKYEKEIDCIGSFTQKLTDNNYLLSIGEKLSNNKALSGIMEQMKYVKTNKEFKILFEKYVNVLKKQPEYFQLKRIFERMHFSDIQNIKSFSTKLISNGEDDLLLNSPKEKYLSSPSSDVLKGDLYAVKATMYSPSSDTSGPDLAYSSTVNKCVGTGDSGPHLSKVSGTIKQVGESNGGSTWVPWFPGKIILSIILAFFHFLSVITGNCNGNLLAILLFLWMP